MATTLQAGEWYRLTDDSGDPFAVHVIRTGEDEYCTFADLYGRAECDFSVLVEIHDGYYVDITCANHSPTLLAEYEARVCTKDEALAGLEGWHQWMR
jgi:hypothetical protein